VIAVHDATGGSVENLRVDGAGRGNSSYRFVGIGFWNAGGAVEDCVVTNIQDTPFSGAQHGVGIYAYNNNGGPYAIDVTGTEVSEYQKNGMALLGTGLTATVTDCTATGKGATAVTAQNGLQISLGAGGDVAGCTISGHMYTPATWAATGLLIQTSSGVDVTDCTLADNYPSVYLIDTSASFTGLDIAHSDAASGDGFYACNTTTSFRGEGVRPAPSPLLDEYADSEVGLRGSMTVTIADSSLVGHDATGSWGAAAFGTGTQNINLTITDSTISHWDAGVVSYYDVGYMGPVSITAHGNILADNVSFGVQNYSTTMIDAEDNFWGHGSGPLDSLGSDEAGSPPCYAPSTMSNVDGLGNGVTDGNVDYCPWRNAPATISLNAEYDCYSSGDDLVVEIYLSDVAGPNNIVGGDFFLEYDENRLQLVDVGPPDNSAVPGDDPFVVEVYECSVDHDGGTMCTPTAGEIDYSVGVTLGNPGTKADTVMARITFDVLAGTNACDLANLVSFRSHAPPTKLSDQYGGAVYAALNAIAALDIDNAPPVITGSVDSGSLSSTCGATVPVSVTVTDNSTSLPVTVTQLLGGYGSSYAIRFNPSGWTSTAGHTYQVTVTAPGLASPISYAVEVVTCP
jgi:hypothetical protein